jgi:hypothetical protein
MEPQQHYVKNEYANWVNEAPSLEISAQRYNQIIHGMKPVRDEQIVPRPQFIR